MLRAGIFSAVLLLSVLLPTEVFADISITKTGPAEVVPGQAISYTITLSTTGIALSEGGAVSDALPPQLENVSWTCAATLPSFCLPTSGTGNISNVSVFIARLFDVEFTINAVVRSDTYASSIDNCASFSGTASGTSCTSAPVQAADLSITKTDGQTFVTAGQSLTYTLTVGNAGPMNAVGARVVDTFPSELSDISWTCSATAGSSCTSSGTGNISDPVDITVGGALTYTVQALVDPSASGTLSNTASVVEGTLTDHRADNNSDTDTDTLVQLADLGIINTDGVTSAVPGESLAYTLTVFNDGPSAVSGVTVIDDFPDSLTCTWSCVPQNSATCTTTQMAGNIADVINMPAGGIAVYTANCVIDPAARGNIVNTASLNAPGVVDSNASNDVSADIDTVLVPKADLSITNSDGVSTAVPGEPITYTVTVSNAGPSDVTAMVEEIFPAELTGVTWTCGASAGSSCTAMGVDDISDTVNLLVGGTLTYSIEADIDPAATGTLMSTATVAALDFTETDAANNSASDLDTVLVPTADLTISKTDGRTSVGNGESLTYTLTVTNGGPSDAPDSVVVDTFPVAIEGVTWTCSASTGSSCPAAGQGDLQESVRLLDGGSVTYEATGTVSATATGDLVNVASVTAAASVSDLNLNNNSAIDLDTSIVPAADLVIAKNDGVLTATPGANVTYTLTVSNLGPQEADGAVVSDVFSNILACTWTCAPAGSSTCTAGPVSGDIDDEVLLPVDGSAVYTAVCEIDPAALGTLSNTATVTAPDGLLEIHSADNSATDTDELVVETALTLTTETSPSTVYSGGELVYLLTVTNGGPSQAWMMTLVDELPAEVELQSVVVSGFDPGALIFQDDFESGDTSRWGQGDGPCVEVEGTVTCELGSLESGGVGTITLSTLVAGSTAAGTYANTATVSTVDGASVTDVHQTVISAGESNLSVEISDDPDPVSPGAELVYTVLVHNAGPSPATGVTLSGHLPPEVTHLESIPSQGSCSLNANVVFCELGGLVADGSSTVVIRVRVSPTATSALTTPVSVGGDQSDSHPEDDTDTEVTTVGSLLKVDGLD